MTSPFQFSDKIGDSILVIGGDDYAEFGYNLQQLFSPEAANFILDKYRERYNQAMNPTAAATSRAQATLGAREAHPANGVQIPPQCKHGDRIERRGTSAKGPYHGWVCPRGQKDADRCEPIWT